MRKLILILLFGVLGLPAMAQDSVHSSDYETALRLIEEARDSGASDLDLTYLKLSELPPEIGQITYLRRLYIHWGNVGFGAVPLKTLPPEIGQLRHLTELWVTFSGLETLPPEIGNLENLELLVLYNNNLRELPPEIGQLTNLRGLDVSYNQLTELPPEIGALSRLELLNLSMNQFQNLLPEIGQLDDLRFLSLYGNQLSSLPQEFANLDDLQSLLLEHNQFQHLPAVLLELDSIEDADAHLVYWYTRNGWGWRGGVQTDGNPLISPPPEVIAQGTPAILDYLRNEAWWHLQRLILSGAGAIAFVCVSILGLRLWQSRHFRKKKR